MMISVLDAKNDVAAPEYTESLEISYGYAASILSC